MLKQAFIYHTTKGNNAGKKYLKAYYLQILIKQQKNDVRLFLYNRSVCNKYQRPK